MDSSENFYLNVYYNSLNLNLEIYYIYEFYGEIDSLYLARANASAFMTKEGTEDWPVKDNE